jgi:hypothetical protein
MESGNHWSRLEKVARYRFALRTLRATGWGSIFFGSVSIALGLAPPWDWVRLFVGAVLLGTGTWSIRSPRPAGVVLDGFSLLMVGAYNILGIGLWMHAGMGVLDSAFWLKLGICQAAWGTVNFLRYARFRDEFHEPAADAELQHLEEIVRGIRGTRASESTDMIEFKSYGWRPEFWKAHLTGDGAVFLASGGEMLVAPRDEVKVTVTGRMWVGRSQWATITINGRKLRCAIAPEYLERYHRWKTGFIVTSVWAA